MPDETPPPPDATSTPGAPSALRRLRQGHSDRILDLLRRHGPCTRQELTERSGLSRTTLAGILAALQSSGVVIETSAPAPDEAAPRRRGRPTTRLALNPGSGQYLGLEFGRRRLRALIADAAHTVRARLDLPFGAARSTGARLDLAEQAVRRLAADHGLDVSALAGIGAGTHGPGESVIADPSGSAAPPQARRPRIAVRLAEAFGAPCSADNNTRLAALAEATWGHDGTAPADLLYAHVSYGIGGGLVLGGQLVRGTAGVAAELGHLPAESDGERCWCGARGCLELSASLPAVLRAAGLAPDARGWDALRAAVDAGEPRALAAARDAARRTGTVLARQCAVVHTGRIVLGGELPQLGAAWLDPLREAFDDAAMTAVRRTTVLDAARLAPWGGAMGGLALALHESPMLGRYPLPGPPAAAAEAEYGG